jgi:hypothetical protein
MMILYLLLVLPLCQAFVFQRAPLTRHQLSLSDAPSTSTVEVAVGQRTKDALVSFVKSSFFGAASVLPFIAPAFADDVKPKKAKKPKG